MKTKEKNKPEENKAENESSGILDDDTLEKVSGGSKLEPRIVDVD